MTVSAEELLARLAAVTTFPEALDLLYQTEYTGAIVLQFFGGRPQVVEVPPARQPSTRIVLDRRRHKRA